MPARSVSKGFTAVAGRSRFPLASFPLASFQTEHDAVSIKNPSALGASEGFARSVDRRPMSVVFDRGLCGGQSRDRHAERAAADVVQSDTVAEFDAGRIAAVFAADADLERLLGVTTFGDAHLDQLPDAGLVERLKRVDFEDFLFHVVRQESADVVTAVTERQLCQVVGA